METLPELYTLVTGDTPMKTFKGLIRWMRRRLNQGCKDQLKCVYEAEDQLTDLHENIQMVRIQPLVDFLAQHPSVTIHDVGMNNPKRHNYKATVIVIQTRVHIEAWRFGYNNATHFEIGDKLEHHHQKALEQLLVICR